MKADNGTSHWAAYVVAGLVAVLLGIPLVLGIVGAVVA